MKNTTLVTVNVEVAIEAAKAATKAPKTSLNYDCSPLKPGEVLIPMIVDDLFIQENVTNPDSITQVGFGGKTRKAVLVAVPEEYAKEVRSQNNLVINEDLGHYATKEGAVSIDEMEDEFELGLAAVPSFEEKLFDSDMTDAIREGFAPILAKSPKLGLAVILRTFGVQGKDFEEAMHLGHDAANTVRAEADRIIAVGLKNCNIEELVSHKTKYTDEYLKMANELLDNLRLLDKLL